MWSHLTSLLLGGSQNAESYSPIFSSEEDGWIIVAEDEGSVNGVQLTLGSLHETNSLPSVSKTPSEITGEEDIECHKMTNKEEEEEQDKKNIMTKSFKRLNAPFSHSSASTWNQIKAVRSAQFIMQKKSSQICSSKKLRRQNKAVISPVKRNPFTSSMKSSGIHKQLKQC